VNFSFGEDQELLRMTIRRFLEQHHSLGYLRSHLEDDDLFDREIWREGASLGWTSMLVPPQYGGGSISDQPLVDLVVIAEELGRQLYPGPFVAMNVVADAIARYAPSEVAAEVLPPFARGDRVGTWCLSGNGGVDPDDIEVAADIAGGGVVLNGVARYVPTAATADDLFVTARTSHGDLIHVLLQATGPGIAIRRQVTIDLTRRFGEVRFAGVELPRSAIIATGDDAEALFERCRSLASVLLAAEGVGAADRLLTATLQYAKDRVQFGRPIGSFQALKHRFADLHMLLEAMRAAAHYAALAFGDDLADAPEAVAIAASFVGDGYVHLCGECLQLHGGIGFTWEHDVHLFLRRARADQVLFGEPHWHRERLCRLLEARVPEGAS
jgi:alkylation response protein AidB-like acyl-CoA dehydrogenase